MARFSFSLQNVLEIKEKMESQAEQEFAAATVFAETQKEILRAIENKLAELEKEAVELLAGILDFRAIEDNQLARNQTQQKIIDQQKNVKNAELELEKARLKMAEAMMERKTYEKLREKAFDEFLAEENKAEGKAVDELTSYTYGRKVM